MKETVRAGVLEDAGARLDGVKRYQPTEVPCAISNLSLPRER